MHPLWFSVDPASLMITLALEHTWEHMQIPRCAGSVFEHAMVLVYTSSSVMITFQKLSFFSEKKKVCKTIEEFQ